MKAGDHVQTTRPIEGSKKNIYAADMELLTICSIEFLPVLLVTKYGRVERFPVRVEHVTSELHVKYIRHIQNDQKKKTLTKWL
jgi:hypothetical protein